MRTPYITINSGSNHWIRQDVGKYRSGFLIDKRKREQARIKNSKREKTQYFHGILGYWQPQPPQLYLKKGCCLFLVFWFLRDKTPTFEGSYYSIRKKHNLLKELQADRASKEARKILLPEWMVLSPPLEHPNQYSDSVFSCDNEVYGCVWHGKDKLACWTEEYRKHIDCEFHVGHKQIGINLINGWRHDVPLRRVAFV